MNLELIFLTFLEHQKSADPDYTFELQSLQKSLGGYDDLETDSHGGVAFKCVLETDGGPEISVDEDLCRRIGAQLAVMGDHFQQEGRIKPEVVESLVHDILNKTLTEDRFADAVKHSLDSIPPGMDLEKATLVVAMSLTSKVGCSFPSLLQNCFTTAVSFIQRNCRSSIGQMTG